MISMFKHINEMPLSIRGKKLFGEVHNAGMREEKYLWRDEFMCTAITYRNGDFYFGRSLDYEKSYGESIAIMPRRFGKTSGEHYAMIGTAHIADDYPLYYDAVNEKGLAAAGLRFAGNAFYSEAVKGAENIAQFELIPVILSECATIREAKERICNINITDKAFSEKLPPSPLHWIFADKDGCITVEQTRDGMKVYENPAGVLTNNPPFPMQLDNLSDYMNISAKPPQNRFSDNWSSKSRFVRAAFAKLNAVSGKEETENVSTFFHILSTVEQLRGCCELENGEHELTVYSACFNADKGIYYYKTYSAMGITAVNMNSENLDAEHLISYPMIRKIIL